MPRLPGRLGMLCAADVMTRQVITIRETDTIEATVAQLRENRITGAPVVDESGRFVGILSVSDLIGRGQERGKGAEERSVPLAHGEDATTWDLFEKARPLEAGETAEAVQTRMSRRVTSVTESAPLVEVVRVMCEGHWHRVPVVDDEGSLAGIISTMDVLAAVVNTADESS